MKLVVADKSILSDYFKIPISFEVKSKYEVTLKDSGLAGYDIKEVQVYKPYIVDHDDDPKEPYTWGKRFDISQWGFIVIYDNDRPIAGAIIAYRSPKVHMLDGRNDMAVLWNLRVHPKYRKMGLGKLIMDEVISWAKERSCSQLKIETQNVNVNACKFYHAMGAKLRGIRHDVYQGEHKDEIQFLWYIDL